MSLRGKRTSFLHHRMNLPGPSTWSRWEGQIIRSPGTRSNLISFISYASSGLNRVGSETPNFNMAVPRASVNILRCYIRPVTRAAPVLQVRQQSGVSSDGDIGGPGSQQTPPPNPDFRETLNRNWYSFNPPQTCHLLTRDAGVRLQAQGCSLSPLCRTYPHRREEDLY
jgi:hypothetical protein